MIIHVRKYTFSINTKDKQCRINSDRELVLFAANGSVTKVHIDILEPAEVDHTWIT